MTQAQIGFLRGLGYAVVYTVVTYVSIHLGESGFFSAGTSAVITGMLGSFEHFLNDPAAPASTT